MFREKRLKNDTIGTSQISNAALVAWLVFGFSCSALSAEEVSAPAQRTSLRLAPIRFGVSSGGNINYRLHHERASYGNSTDQSAGLMVYSTIRARSFIWQPWFAQLNGGLGLELSNSRTSATKSDSSKSTSIAILGDGSLDLIPQSRFPFQASFYKKNSQQKNGLNENNAKGQSAGLSLTQSYRSRNSKFAGEMVYNYSTSQFSHTNLNKKNNFSLGFSHRPFESHNIRMDANITRDNRPLIDYRSLISTLNSSYAYKPSYTYSMSSSLNLFKTIYHQSNNSSSSSSQQFNTVSSWRPNNSTLTLTGSARLYKFQSMNNNTTAQPSIITSLYLGASYALSQGIRASGSINVSDSSGAQTLITNASLTSTKSFTDITNIAGFIYKRFISGSLSTRNRSTSGISQSSSTSQSLGLSAGHSLTNNTRLYDGSLISNVNQIISSSINSSASSPPIPHLLTNGSMVWARAGQKDRSLTTARLTASDSRDLSSNSNKAPMQIFNLQAGRNEALARNQSLYGTLTLQLTRQGASPTSQSSRTSSSSANLNYKHMRAFNVPRLLFFSIIRADHNILMNDQTENILSWENNLLYTIGRTDLALNVLFSEINNNKRSSLTFKANRTF